MSIAEFFSLSDNTNVGINYYTGMKTTDEVRKADYIT